MFGIEEKILKKILRWKNKFAVFPLISQVMLNPKLKKEYANQMWNQKEKKY